MDPLTPWVASTKVVYESGLIAWPGVSCRIDEGHRVILRETVQSHSSKGIDAMTTAHDIDWPQVLAERLTTTHPDVLRELLATFIHALMARKLMPCAAPDMVSAAPNVPISERLSPSPIRPAQGHWI